MELVEAELECNKSISVTHTKFCILKFCMSTKSETYSILNITVHTICSVPEILRNERIVTRQKRYHLVQIFQQGYPAIGNFRKW